MKVLVIGLLLISQLASILAILNINDTDMYKPCIPDSTSAVCPHSHACFQYFCYPKEAGPQDPLKSCKKRSQCKNVDGAPKCFKQGLSGICVSEEEYREWCEGHNECEGRGGKCCGDYCCNEEYFEAFKKITCEEDDVACEVAQ